jgi:branched-chain amino acid transport system ATP-binding protein
MTIVLVEQHARIALSIATRAAVMDRGRIVLERPSAALLEMLRSSTAARVEAA